MAPTVKKEWSLGEPPPPGYRLVREVYPRPDRPGIGPLVQEILSQGMVQRIVVQTREPVTVLRLVKEADTDPTMDEVIVQDLFNQARNVEMVQLPAEDESQDPLRTIFCAFRAAAERQLLPRAILVQEAGWLQDWIGVDRQEEMLDVFGVPVVEHDEIPNDVLLFAVTSPEAPEALAMSFRIAMDIPRGE